MSIQGQAMLLVQPSVSIKTCHMLNSATLLPTEMGFLEYDCTETTDMTYSSCPTQEANLSGMPKMNGLQMGALL